MPKSRILIAASPFFSDYSMAPADGSRLKDSEKKFEAPFRGSDFPEFSSVRIRHPVR
jgi:hypothetical protein